MLDLFVGNIAGEANFLYHGEGGGSFSRVTTGAMAGFLQSDTEASNAAFGDFNNDGRLDIYSGYLYLNEGDGTFSRVDSSNFNTPLPPGPASQVAKSDDHLEVETDGRPGSTGSPVASEWCVSGRGIQCMYQFHCAVLGDFNNDGLLDVFGSLNDEDGTSFTDMATSCVACAAGDFDDDGLLDVFDCTTGYLCRNFGGGDIRNITTGVIEVDALGKDGEHPIINDAAFGDWDGDGHLDLVVARGVALSKASPDGGTPGLYTNILYRNLGDGAFVRVNIAGADLTTDESVSNFVAFADYNHDGGNACHHARSCPATSLRARQPLAGQRAIPTL